MEDRYEILEKVGQGGIGSVHRGYDHKMRREVAIKRILTSSEDPTLKDEATKQLMVEASALASLQHPHIVSIFDVGADIEGPYVVMELINGKTLDEIIESAPLVWNDFKEVAMQSLEALIAAQELNMIHSDLKPPNIMLTWLPSGRFQVKIVDFGLAVLVQNQSQEEIEQMDSVFGSIFFMPPEQFERQILDARSDLYSLGCCFYQALAGKYPFGGTTGAEVMNAHLTHTAIPLQEVRKDIPEWACLWVMWLINRYREDRPQTAREALANFVQNDKMSMATLGQSAAQAVRSRLIIPPSSPEVITTSIASVTASTKTSENLVSPLSGSHGLPQSDHTHSMRSKLLGWPLNKLQIKIIAGIAAAVVVCVLFGVIKTRNHKIRIAAFYNNFTNMAVKSDAKSIPISAAELQIVLDHIGKLRPGANLDPSLHGLVISKASDGSDLDIAIAQFATRKETPSNLRQKLFTEVIELRAEASVVPVLIDFAEQSEDPTDTATALHAIRNLINESDAPKLLGILSSHKDTEVRRIIEKQISEIIYYSKSPNKLEGIIKGYIKPNTQQESRVALERLMDTCRPKVEKPTTPPVVTKTPTVPQPPAPVSIPANNIQSSEASPEVNKLVESFDSADDPKKREVIAALGKTGDFSANKALHNLLQQSQNQEYFTAIIEALIEVNSSPALMKDTNQARIHWKQIIWRCKTDEQKIKVIQGLASIRSDWTVSILEELGRAKTGPVADAAQKALSGR